MLGWTWVVGKWTLPWYVTYCRVIRDTGKFGCVHAKALWLKTKSWTELITLGRWQGSFGVFQGFCCLKLQPYKEGHSAPNWEMLNIKYSVKILRGKFILLPSAQVRLSFVCSPTPQCLCLPGRIHEGLGKFSVWAFSHYFILTLLHPHLAHPQALTCQGQSHVFWRTWESSLFSLLPGQHCLLLLVASARLSCRQ